MFAAFFRNSYLCTEFRLKIFQFLALFRSRSHCVIFMTFFWKYLLCTDFFPMKNFILDFFRSRSYCVIFMTFFRKYVLCTDFFPKQNSIFLNIFIIHTVSYLWLFVVTYANHGVKNKDKFLRKKIFVKSHYVS